MKYRSDSLRLKNYDYASVGYYFITICTKNRQNYFGEIQKDEMALNSVGEIVKKFWYEIPNHFENITVDEFIVMPNHIHGIIVIKDWEVICKDAINHVPTIENNPMGKNNLSEIVRWYKGRCTYEIRKFMSDFTWQPRFYDHIIRNEESLFNIRQYIRFNAQNWDKDENNKKL